MNKCHFDEFLNKRKHRILINVIWTCLKPRSSKSASTLHHSHHDPSIHQHTTMDFDPDPIEPQTNAFNSAENENPRTMDKTINNRNKSNPAASVRLISASRPKDSVSNGTHRHESAMDTADKRGTNKEVKRKLRENSSGVVKVSVLSYQYNHPNR